ncbi:MAG: VOC family protein [Alphaproteobacteria bacterium]|nr:VOC family protein [Alphaproteobacteria bacterium]
MFYYITIGTNDVARGTRFYDPVMKALGFERNMADDTEIGYGAPGSKTTVFYITRPFDKSRPAGHGNGTMLAFPAKTRPMVDAFHAAALANGGSDDGKPGLRPYAPDWYACYVRDPDGNKLSAVCRDGF